MALSRTLSQSLPRVQPVFSLIALRGRSTKANPQLIEVDLDSATDSAEVITVGIKTLEDVIQSIIVKRAAPDWLPFLPGYSYWVPPRASSSSSTRARTQADSVIEIVGKLAEASASASRNASSSSTRRKRKLLGRNLLESDDDEKMAISSSRGWPSLDFFIQGTSWVHPISMVEVEVHIQDPEDKPDGSPNSDDDEK